MGDYEDNLEHVAEPQAPNDRETAPSATLHDYEALWFADQLREFAHYEADDNGDIAIAYASYIDAKVRDEGVSNVDCYVHTDTAASILMAAVEHATEDDDPYTTLQTRVESEIAATAATYTNR